MSNCDACGKEPVVHEGYCEYCALVAQGLVRFLSTEEGRNRVIHELARPGVSCLLITDGGFSSVYCPPSSFERGVIAPLPLSYTVTCEVTRFLSQLYGGSPNNAEENSYVAEAEGWMRENGYVIPTQRHPHLYQAMLDQYADSVGS